MHGLWTSPIWILLPTTIFFFYQPAYLKLDRVVHWYLYRWGYCIVAYTGEVTFYKVPKTTAMYTWSICRITCRMVCFILTLLNGQLDNKCVLRPCVLPCGFTCDYHWDLPCNKPVLKLQPGQINIRRIFVELKLIKYF